MILRINRYKMLMAWLRRQERRGATPSRVATRPRVSTASARIGHKTDRARSWRGWQAPFPHPPHYFSSFVSRLRRVFKMTCTWWYSYFLLPFCSFPSFVRFTDIMNSRLAAPATVLARVALLLSLLPAAQARFFCDDDDDNDDE